jgi:hypothetical protein
MLWEERQTGQRANLGLLFIVPQPALESHWTTLGLETAKIDSGFIGRLDADKLPRRIIELFEANPADVRRIAARLRMNVVSWSLLVQELKSIEEKLCSPSAGDQTLLRLLTGFRNQIEVHGGTGFEAVCHAD